MTVRVMVCTGGGHLEVHPTRRLAAWPRGPGRYSASVTDMMYQEGGSALTHETFVARAGMGHVLPHSDVDSDGELASEASMIGDASAVAA